MDSILQTLPWPAANQIVSHLSNEGRLSLFQTSRLSRFLVVQHTPSILHCPQPDAGAKQLDEVLLGALARQGPDLNLALNASDKPTWLGRLCQHAVDNAQVWSAVKTLTLGHLDVQPRGEQGSSLLLPQYSRAQVQLLSQAFAAVRTLALGHIRIKEMDALAPLSALPALSDLHLFSCSLKGGACLTCISTFTSLQHLALTDVPLIGEAAAAALSAIASCSSLKKLTMRGLQTDAVARSAMQQLARSTSLETISLSKPSDQANYEGVDAADMERLHVPTALPPGLTQLTAHWEAPVYGTLKSESLVFKWSQHSFSAFKQPSTAPQQLRDLCLTGPVSLHWPDLRLNGGGEGEHTVPPAAWPQLRHLTRLSLNFAVIRQPDLDLILQHLTLLQDLTVHSFRDLTESRAGAQPPWKVLAVTGRQPLSQLALLPLSQLSQLDLRQLHVQQPVDLEGWYTAEDVESTEDRIDWPGQFEFPGAALFQQADPQLAPVHAAASALAAALTGGLQLKLGRIILGVSSLDAAEVENAGHRVDFRPPLSPALLAALGPLSSVQHQLPSIGIRLENVIVGSHQLLEIACIFGGQHIHKLTLVDCGVCGVFWQVLLDAAPGLTVLAVVAYCNAGNFGALTASDITAFCMQAPATVQRLLISEGHLSWEDFKTIARIVGDWSTRMGRPLPVPELCGSRGILEYQSDPDDPIP